MTPTIYAVAWLVITVCGGSNGAGCTVSAIPMPSMQVCAKAREDYNTGYNRGAYEPAPAGCLSGQPTQQNKG